MLQKKREEFGWKVQKQTERRNRWAKNGKWKILGEAVNDDDCLPNSIDAESRNESMQNEETIT